MISETEIAGHKVCEGDIGKLIYIECPSGKSSADNSTTAGSGGGVIAGKNFFTIHNGAINSSGELFLLIQAGDFLNPTFKFAKYSASGSLDSTFGTNGELDVSSIFLGNTISMKKLVIDSSGNMYAAYGDSSTTYVVKFDSSGNVVSSFGTDGKMTISEFALKDLDVNTSKIAAPLPI